MYSFLERKVQFVAASFSCAAYIIVLGIWLKLFIAMNQIQRPSNTSINSSYVSAKDELNKSASSKLKKWLLPCCLILGIIQIITTVIEILLKYQVSDLMSLTGCVVFSILALGYLSYAVLLCIFRSRIRSRSTRRIFIYVISLSVLLSISFIFRLVNIALVSDDSTFIHFTEYFYYLF